MGWRIWKRSREGGGGKGKRGEGTRTLCVASCFRMTHQETEGQQAEEEDRLELKELEPLCPPEENHVQRKKEEAQQEQNKHVQWKKEEAQPEQDEEEVKFLRMRWVPVKKRRRLKLVRCLCCCLRKSKVDDEDEEDEEEYFKRLSDVWSRRKSDTDCTTTDENKEAASNEEDHAGDQSRSQECKKEAVYVLASYVKTAALKLEQEKSKLRRVHCELQNIEKICNQLVVFIIEDRGAHWKDYESLFLLFMVMVKPLFHRVLQYEECSVMIKAIERLREYINEILCCAKRIIGFFPSGERETLECFIKASEEWVSPFEGDNVSPKIDDPFLADDEDIHLKYNFLTRRLRKDQTRDIKEKILGKNNDERKNKNIEEHYASNCNEVELAQHPFKHVIPYFTKPQHSPNPKRQFMEFYHEDKAFNETPQMLYMLQTIMIYVVDTQKKVQIDETRILKLRDEFENIEEAMIQVMDFICEDQGASTTQVYEDKLLEIKKLTQPMFRHVVQQEEWSKMMRMMRAIKSLCYRIVFRIQRWHFLNIFSQEMIGKMKILLDDLTDWMVDVSDKISAFETCERIEESQRFNNLLPDNEVLYSRIIRRIQKLKDNVSDDLDVWMSCLYRRDLGFTRSIIIHTDNELSSDEESNCDGKATRLKLLGGGVAEEMCEPVVSASVDNQAVKTLCCYSRPVSIGDLQVSVSSAAGNEENGTNKRNTGQGDVRLTEKEEENPAQNPVGNIVLDVVNSGQCQMSLDMTIIMWICALLYFWKQMSGFD